MYPLLMCNKNPSARWDQLNCGDLQYELQGENTFFDIGSTCERHTCHNEHFDRPENIVRQQTPSYRYKVYTHTLSAEKLKSNRVVTNIRHKGTLQTGLPNSVELARWFIKSLSVYYWEHDYDNQLPLVIKIVNVGNNRLYFVNSGICSNHWENVMCENVLDLLSYTKNMFNEVVVIDLDRSEGNYFGTNLEDACDLNTACNNVMNVVIDEHFESNELIKFVHKRKFGSNFRILYTVFKENIIPVENVGLDETFKELFVFYWDYTDDYRHKEMETVHYDKPLLLELVSSNGTKKYYRRKGNVWTNVADQNVFYNPEKNNNFIYLGMITTYI
ncbi:hypothetical protein BEWA_026580 [Theileria equi strain WA]|uniref:Uncharacterized protein n=1 Tax=Theileria equi strain WA TaxID=1537102 RepID=L0AY20_THEEQ|nr:hypothetical protein BEWA_026580 [Theileria equi strain WA]AFZ79809.1 hypothetical protein BEWA_026580 [Theileria equi strain WA]|eukprot:XP_004829475.1 hypothetical protein BEWA_026580 [Theileria equi strain WA]